MATYLGQIILPNMQIRGQIDGYLSFCINSVTFCLSLYFLRNSPQPCSNHDPVLCFQLEPNQSSTHFTLISSDWQRWLQAITAHRNRLHYWEWLQVCGRSDGISVHTFLRCRNKQLSWHVVLKCICVGRTRENSTPHGCRNLRRPVSRLAGLVWHRVWAPRWHINSVLYLTHWTPLLPMFPFFLKRLPKRTVKKWDEVICNYTEWIQPPTSFHRANTLRDNEMEGTLFFLFTINPTSLVALIYGVEENPL